MADERELDILRQQLAEAHSTLDAIRRGEVDAVMVDVGEANEVYTLQSADLPYRDFLEHMAEGAASLDRNFVVLYCNEFLCDLLGVPREMMLGRRLTEWLDSAARGELERATEAKERTSVAANVLPPGSEPIPVHMSIVPATYSARRVNVVFSDQRSAYRLQKVMEARNAARAESDAKDRFLAVLGHELRNPLSALTNSVAVLVSGDLEPGLQQRIYQSMGRQLGQLKSLVDDLLDLTRVAQGKITLKKDTLTLVEVVQQALESVRSNIDQKRQTLNIDVPDSLCLQADRTRLEQILSNLLSNAARYTPIGGTITVSARLRGDRVEVVVVDTGVGIEAHQLERIFEPFTQIGEEGAGGLGIGLSLVRQLVQLHGGAVVAESQGAGHGTTFRLELPGLVPLHAEAVSLEQPSAPTWEGLRVLVVDDHEDSAELLALLLRARGQVVETALRGAEVLDMVASFNPELLLLDLGLPDVPGHVVAQQLRAAGFCDLVIIALTGFSHEGARTRVAQSGFDDHIVKPITVDQLLAVMNRFRSRLRRPNSAQA